MANNPNLLAGAPDLINSYKSDHQIIQPTTAASQDSEDEAAQISAEPLGGGGVVESSTGGGRSSPSGRVSGHHDPKQRVIYLSLLAFSAASALLGLALLLTWMYKYRPTTGLGVTDKAQLANLHPILMFTFMVSLNAYSVLVYRTHYAQPKQRLKWTHAILSGTNIVMSLLGVAAMYKAHLLSGLANFYSLHSWIGALTNAFYLAQFLVGLVAFLKPGMSQARREALMPWHRMAGAAILVLAATAAITGMAELVIFQDKDGVYQKFTAITFIANIAGISVVLMTATTIYLLTAPQYLRPALASLAPESKR